MISLLTGYRFFNSKILFNITSALLTGISLACAVILVMVCKNTSQQLYSCQGLVNEQGAYYIGGNPTYLDNTFLNELENVKSIGTVSIDSLQKNNKIIYTLLATPDVAQNIKLPLKKGKWFTDVEETPDIINMVAEEKLGFEVGDIIEFKRGNKTVKVLITGILANNSQIYNFNGFYTPTDASVFMEKNDYQIFDTGTMVGLIDYEIDYMSYSSGIAIFYNQNISDDAAQRNLTKLQQHGMAASFDTIMDNTKSNYYQKIISYLPIVIITAILSVLATVSSVMVTLKNNEKQLKVLYFSGAGKNQLLASIMFFSLILLLISAVFLFITVILIAAPFERSGLILYADGIFYTILIYCIMYFSLNFILERFRIKRFMEEI